MIPSLKQILQLFVLTFPLIACQKIATEEQQLSTPRTRAYLPYVFDWANADWMPTPPGQSRIPSPWVGEGSIVSAFGMDITNDRYPTDGWELLYNSFTPHAPGTLVNPYFVLYNKYRGTIRFYLYVTSSFIANSTNLQDGISVISDHPTSLLRFLGREISVDSTDCIKQYHQIQPAPSDGSSPLATNKWYMLQYELAYDPDLKSVPYTEIQVSWYLNYTNIYEIDLGGSIEGTIRGTIGSADNSGRREELDNLFQISGTGVLAGIGTKFITDNEVNAATGENRLGLHKSVFKSISSGLQNALSSAASTSREPFSAD